MIALRVAGGLIMLCGILFIWRFARLVKTFNKIEEEITDAERRAVRQAEWRARLAERKARHRFNRRRDL